MKSSKFCLRACTVLILCFLLFQLYLFSYIKDKVGSNLNSSNSKVFEIYKGITVDLNDGSYLDKSGMYKIITVSGKKSFQPLFDVAYVLQCSWNRIHLINDILKAWQGPVSVAVFSEIKHMDEALWRLSEAIFCHRHKDLDLSLVVPAQDMYVLTHDYARDMAMNLNESDICKLTYATNYKDTRNYNWSTPYPVNLLRNVAKINSKTEYVLVADIDIIPSKDLRKNFLRYVWSRKVHPKKMIFVVPVFEMMPDAVMPETKLDIVTESKKGNIRPFYALPCRKCQLLTNYSKWFSYPSIPGTRALYKVEWKHPWEPFYISHRDVPDFDERFKQYGFNRVSQLCRLYVEGYTFLVLDNVFLVHKGFKSNEDFHNSKQAEMDSNRVLYEEYKEELMLKYPGRRCDG